MNLGPTIALAFLYMDNSEKYKALTEAVENGDEQQIKTMVAYDGLKFKKDNVNVGMYFAMKNNGAACDLLEKYGANRKDFVLGAILGGHLELFQKYTRNLNIFKNKSDILDFSAMIIAIGRSTFEKPIIEIIEKSKKLIPHHFVVNPRQYDWAKYLVETLLTDKLDEKYKVEHAAQLAQAAAELGKEDLVQFYISKTTPNYTSLIFAAAKHGFYQLSDNLRAKSGNKDNIKIAILGAIYSGNLDKTEEYINEAESLSIDINYAYYALKAAELGDVHIAFTLYCKVNLEQRDFKVLSNAAREHGFLNSANLFDHVGKVVLKISNYHTPTVSGEGEGPKDSMNEEVTKGFRNNIASILTFDLPKQNKNKIEYGDDLDFEDINILLEALLTIFEKENLISLVKHRNNYFISENDAAYHTLKTLVQEYTWIDRTCFTMPRAKLEASHLSTKITLEQFYDFMNKCHEKLLELAPKRKEMESEKEEKIVAQIKAQSYTALNTPTIPDIQESTKIKTPKIAREPATPFNSNSNAVKFQTPKKVKKAKKPKNKSKSVTAAIPNKANTATTPSVSSNKCKTTSTLPKQDPVEHLPNKEPKANIENWAKNSKSIQTATQAQQTDTKLSTLKMLLGSKDDLIFISSLKTQDPAIADQLYDLALLDILFKIHRELFLVPNSSTSRELYKFDCEVIHGVHHYLSQDAMQYSDLWHFMNSCFDFEKADPKLAYINSLVRVSLPFVHKIHNQKQVSVTDRLQLIKKIYHLQQICLKLCKEQNNELTLMAKHALSATIIILGEQFAQLDNNTQAKLFESGFGKVLDTYRLYRNLRHGHDDIQRKLTLVDTGLQVVFNMERDDWDQSLLKMVENFELNHTRYFNTRYEACIEQLIGEPEPRYEQPTRSFFTHYPNQVSSSNPAPKVDDLSVKFSQMKL